MNTEKLDSSMPPLRILRTKRLSFPGDAVYDGGTLVTYDMAASLVEWREMPQQHFEAFQTSMRRFAMLLSHVDTSVATVRCKGLLNRDTNGDERFGLAYELPAEFDGSRATETGQQSLYEAIIEDRQCLISGCLLMEGKVAEAVHQLGAVG